MVFACVRDQILKFFLIGGKLTNVDLTRPKVPTQSPERLDNYEKNEAFLEKNSILNNQVLKDFIDIMLTNATHVHDLLSCIPTTPSKE